MATVHRAPTWRPTTLRRGGFCDGGLTAALEPVATSNGRDPERAKPSEARELRRQLRRLPRPERRLTDEQVAEERHYFELAQRYEAARALVTA
jgi:hypothetical protein